MGIDSGAGEVQTWVGPSSHLREFINSQAGLPLEAWEEKGRFWHC